MRKKRTEKKAVEKIEKKPYEYDAAIVSNIVIKGDLSGLSQQEIVRYYNDFCHSLGLNPVTKPFDVIDFKRKNSDGTYKTIKTLYANRNCAEQLRAIRGVSIYDIKTESINGLYIVKAYAQDHTGRQDVGTAAIDLTNKRGDDLANAIMKAETKAKRRVSLSLCAIGLMDESELDTIGQYKKAEIRDVSPEIKKDENYYFRTQNTENQVEEIVKVYENEMHILNGILKKLENKKYKYDDDEQNGINNINIDFDLGKITKERIDKAIKYYTKKLESMNVQN